MKKSIFMLVAVFFLFSCSKQTGDANVGQFSTQVTQFPEGITPSNPTQELQGSDTIAPQGIIARKSAWLRHHTQVNTNVYVLGNCTGEGCLDPAEAPANPNTINNANSELTIGVSVTVPAGRVLKADKIRLKNRANVLGTTEANTYAQQKSATITNKVSALGALPYLPFFLSGTPGTQNINDATATLAPGQYRNLTVRKDKTVTLTGGFYQFQDIDLKKKSSLLCQTQCFVTVKVDVISEKEITLSATSGNPNDFVVYVEGGSAAAEPMAAAAKAVQLGGMSHVTANIYAVNGRLQFGAATIAQGAFIGNHVRIEPNSIVTAGPAPVGTVKLFEAGVPGSIEIPGKVKLNVPACALQEDTVISIKQVPSGAENTIRNAQFNTLTGNVYEMQPHGLSFRCGVNLGINYNPEQLAQQGITLGSLVMLQSQDGRFVRRVLAEPVMTANQLNATISHFSFYFLGYISNSAIGAMQVYGDTIYVAPGPLILNDGSVYKNKAQTFRRTGDTVSLIADNYQTDCPAGVVWCFVNEQASNGAYLFVSYIYFDGLLETQENKSGKIDIFDISMVGSPTNPVFLKSLDAADGIVQPDRMKIFGNSLVLTDTHDPVPDSQPLLQIINVTDINAPSIVNIPSTDVIADFEVSGTTLYLHQRAYSDSTDVRIVARNLTNGALLGNLIEHVPYDTDRFAILGQKIYIREWDGPITAHTFSGTTITATQQSPIIPGFINIIPTGSVLYTGSAADPAQIIALNPVDFSQIGSYDLGAPIQDAWWQLASVGDGYLVANRYVAIEHHQSTTLQLIRFDFPVLAALQPAEGATYVPVNTPIVIDFNNPMNGATLIAATNSSCTGTTIQVSADGFSTCAAMASANPVMSNGGKTATFTPTGLLPDKVYQIRLTGNVLDSGGAPAAAFTQVVGWNTLVRPQVASISPADGATNVPTSTPISITFGQQMNPATLTASTTTTCTGSVQVSADNFATCVPMSSAAGVMSNGGQTVTFAPQVLVAGARLKIKILPVLQSVAGGVMGSAYLQTLGFETEHQWRSTGNLSVARMSHTATLLADGRVLVVGGTRLDGSTINTAEIFDLALNSGNGGFTTSNPMVNSRFWHTATRLADGRVLITGGVKSGVTVIADAEIFDPSANFGTGGFIPILPMSTPRSRHIADLLPDGRVLIAGGHNGTTTVHSAEIFDPLANSGAGGFSPTGQMSTVRSNHVSTRLNDGRILITGGSGIGYFSSAEIFDSTLDLGVGGFTYSGSMAFSRVDHTATLMSNGKVLIAGGRTWGPPNYLAAAELFDAALGIGAFSNVQPMSAARLEHSAVALGDNRVLITGGYDGNTGELFSFAEIFNIDNGGSFAVGPPMANPRRLHTATLLANGHVLVVGGGGNSGFLNSAEIFQ